MKTLVLKSLIAFLVFVPTLHLSAQDSTAPYVRSKWGNLFSLDFGWDEQRNLNRVLRSVNLPSTRNFTTGFTLGWVYQPGRFEAGGDIALLARSGERNDVQMDRIITSLSINAKYLVGKKESRWYPMVSVGTAAAVNRITPQNASTDLTTALTTNRNTTSLWSQQGFAGFGLGFRFSDNGRSFSGLEAGYRLGFAANAWSTRPRNGNMAASVTDELRQFYVRLVGGGFKRKRS